MISGRRDGSIVTTTAPMSGVAMIAVRIGKPGISVPRTHDEVEQKRRGAERDADGVPADVSVLRAA